MPKNLSATSPDASAQAREQASAYDSVFADTELTLDNGEVIRVPPHPDLGMLGDDEMAAYEELLFEVDTEYARDPDIYIPEQKLRDDKGVETGVVLPAETRPGALKRPYRYAATGELVKPPHSIRVVKAALGETEYKRLREGGKNAADVWRIWARQGTEIKDRQAGDSKSDGGPLDLAAVPAPDSK